MKPLPCSESEQSGSLYSLTHTHSGNNSNSKDIVAWQCSGFCAAQTCISAPICACRIGASQKMGTLCIILPYKPASTASCVQAQAYFSTERAKKLGSLLFHLLVRAPEMQELMLQLRLHAMEAAAFLEAAYAMNTR
eukprot:scaffold85054_cov18-Tisochrysis_lutea.AAC.3